MTKWNDLAKEQEVMEALQDVLDPELGMSVVDLGLIREIHIGKEETEVKMLLTTPFCPMAGWIVDQVREMTELVVGTPAKVIVLPELWDSNMMQV